jgi:hypothetical protein
MNLTLRHYKMLDLSSLFFWVRDITYTCMLSQLVYVCEEYFIIEPNFTAPDMFSTSHAGTSPGMAVP